MLNVENLLTPYYYTVMQFKFPNITYLFTFFPICSLQLVQSSVARFQSSWIPCVKFVGPQQQHCLFSFIATYFFQPKTGEPVLKLFKK